MHSVPFRHRSALLFACVLPLGFACSKSASVDSKTPSLDSKNLSTKIVHEECDMESKSTTKTDVNNDGRADITRVMNGAREVCRVLDLNFDGRVDNFLYFDEAGKLRRRESDFDRDGIIDEIGLYKNGKVIQKHRETNLDGALDTWDTYTNERITERLRDTNADGKVDQWWTFPDPAKPECPVVATDEDGDGKPDARHDPCKEREAEMNATAQPWERADQDAGSSSEEAGSGPNNTPDASDNNAAPNTQDSDDSASSDKDGGA
ncbi:MAG: hypothetical protein CSA75_00430 [Sorangium cellulosum]|nr:MAG: hypothetical protein CSA75_00430 [Sorangium cellulosum]